MAAAGVLPVAVAVVVVVVAAAAAAMDPTVAAI